MVDTINHDNEIAECSNRVFDVENCKIFTDLLIRQRETYDPEVVEAIPAISTMIPPDRERTGKELLAAF